MQSLTNAMIAYLAVKPIVEGLRVGIDKERLYYFIETSSGELVCPPEDLAAELARNRPRLLRFRAVQEAVQAAEAGKAAEFYRMLP